MGKFSYLLSVVALLCSVIWSASAVGQTGKGAVAGTVKDSGGFPLPGAIVEVQPSGKRVVTDSQGQFRIQDLAPGEYTVSFSYVGFAPSTAKATVEAGQTANLDGELKVASQSDQVIVTAERVQGEAEAINIERTADNIVQVLPSQVITSLPNTNIADAVGRFSSVTLERDEGEGKYVQIRGTEPRLSNVTINGVNVPSPEGNVRNIKLDAIPSDIVDRIEINKTLSANQDADAIGGSVNLVTKTPGERPTYNFFAQGGYTPIQGGRTLDSFGGTVGRRFGSSKKLGVLLGGTYDHNNRGIDDLEPSQSNPPAPPFNGKVYPVLSGQDLRTYEYYRTRYGFAGGVDYSLRPGSSVYIKGLYSDFHDYGDTYVYTPNYGNRIKSVNGSTFTFMNAADCLASGDSTCSPGFMTFRHYIRRPDQQIFSVLTGARHDLTSTLITYEFAVSRAHNITGQDFPTTNFNGPAVDLGLDLSDPYRPQFKVLDGTNIYDPKLYSIANTVAPYYHSTQLNFQGAASLARRYTVKGHYGTFEVGTKIRNAHKYQKENDRFFDATGTFTLDTMLGTYSNPTYYDKSYPLGPFSDYQKIVQITSKNIPTGFTEKFDKNHIISDAATWDTSERVYAGYGMNTISLGKFRVQTGVRVEATDSGFLANKIKLNQGAYDRTDPVTGSSGYINVLPSVQVQYMLTGDTNIRASFGMSISRPNFQDLVPSQQVDPNTVPKTLQIGNPNLIPTKANNYDILVEHFFRPLGILQAGFFYKQLSDPIYQTVSLAPPGDPFAGYLRQQSINGPAAHITGFEASWEQRLSRLPGFLSGFGVAANYSYTASQVTFPEHFSAAVSGGEGRIDHPTLQRQAPNTWNVGMTYDKARFSMRFGISHNDANLFAYGYSHTDAATDRDPILGLKGPLGDQYLYGHTQFDVQGSYRLYKGLHIIAYGLNLSNEVFGFYTGSPIYPNQREYYHPTIAGGFRWTSSGE
jgi:TonB-dependent receptor